MKRSSKKDEWCVPVGRWSAADGEAMVAAYRRSGLSMRAFAQKHGLGTHRVSYWRAKVDERVDGGKTKPGFVPVQIAGEAASDERSVEVRLRGGQTLTLVGDWDGVSIRTWVGAAAVAS